MVILKRAEMGGGRRGVKPCDPSKVKVERGGSGYVKPETVLKGAGIVGKVVSVSPVSEEQRYDPPKESLVDGADIPAKECVGGEVCMPEFPMEEAEREWTEEEYRARDERLAAADAAGVAFTSVEGGGGRRKRRRRKHRHG